MHVTASQQLVRNISRSQPRFVLAGLQSTQVTCHSHVSRAPPHATCPQPVTVTVYAWNPRGRSEAVTVVRGVEIADTRAEAGPGHHSDYAGQNGRAFLTSIFTII